MSDDEANTSRRRSSRVPQTSAKKNHQTAALEKIRQSRSGGKKVKDSIQDVYEIISEEDFERRRAHDQFVEDDDGTGYYDDGLEDDWEELEDEPNSSKHSSSRKKAKEEKKKPKGGIYEFLVPTSRIKNKPSDDVPCNLDDDKDLLACLDQISNTPAQEADLITLQQKRPASEMPAEAPIPKQPKQTPVEELEIDDDVGGFDDFDDEAMQLPNEGLEVGKPLSDLKFATKSEESTENFVHFAKFVGNADEEDVMDVTENTKENALQMYWIEAFEDPYKHRGNVYLFGRVNNKSCCVVAKNIEHKIYFVPREFDENGNADFESIHSEVQEKFFNGTFFANRKFKDPGLRTKPMDVKFVPTYNEKTNNTTNERKTLMTLYKGSLPKISPTTQGKTFSHVLNTTATAMERLLVELKLRVETKTNKLSHCELEYTVDMKSMKNIRPIESKTTGQRISLLSFYICGGSSTESKETEIVMIVCLLRRVPLDCTTVDAYDNKRQYETCCFIAPPKKRIASNCVR
ncbi:DNA polymerase alpha catalytic subunit [Aphelenchoides besseyi]|nr:DNA polymerase alpha catalytic subunit [Aphelenchoides besseyi]